jgi:hypothetical protein
VDWLVPEIRKHAARAPAHRQNRTLRGVIKHGGSSVTRLLGSVEPGVTVMRIRR